MKRIFLGLLIISSFANAQMDTSRLYKYPTIYSGYRFKNAYLDSFLRGYFPQVIIDTTNKKILVTDVNGNVSKSYWPSTGISAITADNGLTPSTSTNVQLGGTLLSNTTIAGNGKYLLITGNDGTVALQASNSSTGYGMQTSGNDGYGIYASSVTAFSGFFTTTSGNGLYSQSTSGLAGKFYIQPTSTNTAPPMLELSRRVSGGGTAADGIGLGIDFKAQTDDAVTNLSNQLISKFTTAANATRTSQFSITGVTSATTETWLTIGQSGFLQVRPMTVTEAGALTPAEGMLIFVSNTNGTFGTIGFYGYQNGAWHAF